MRIAIDVRHLATPEPSGVAEYTLELLRALFAAGPEHQYLLLSTGTRPAFELVRGHLDRLGERPSNVEHRHQFIPNKLVTAATLLDAWPQIDSLLYESVDVFFFPNLGFQPATVRNRVVTVHDCSFASFPHLYDWRRRLWHRLVRPGRTLRDARAVLVPSEATKRDVAAHFGVAEERIHVTPLGLDPIFLAPLAPATPGPRYLLYLGTLEPRKNIDALVEAYDDYRRTTGNAIELWIGGGRGWNMRPLERAIAASPFRADIRLLGYVAREDKPALYRNAQAFVFPSIYEGFGLPVLEAMACGTPVITSHTGSLPEVAGDAAILIDPFNIADLSAALRILLGDAELCARLAVRGQERARAFTWNATAQRTLAAFRTVTHRP